MRDLVIIVTFLFCCKLNSQTWIKLPDFPGSERDDGVAFVIGNKAYVGTGLAIGWALTRDFYCLDLSNDTWSQITSLPIGKERQYACGFSYGNNGFVFGGESGGSDLNDLWMYSPTSNSWTAKTSKPGSGIRGAACFVIGDTAYIVGGATGTLSATSEVWAYIISNDTWVQKSNAPFTSWKASGSDYNGAGTILGGKEINGRMRKEIMFYSPTFDTWQQNGLFFSGRIYSTLQCLGNMLYTYCGLDSLNNCYNDAYSYWGPANIWQPLNSIPSIGRKGGMGFKYMTFTYYTCGIDQNGNRLKETWKADQYVGIKQNEDYNELIISPNPSNGRLKISWQSITKESKELSIYNQIGVLIKKEDIKNGSQIDLSTLPKGVYFLVLDNFRNKIILE